MGTASTKKFIKQVNGQLTEEAALTTSAGAGDANKVPALNASGVLDHSIINATVTSAGAGDSGKTPALDSTGRLDTSVMPVGIGAETGSIVASEDLDDGDFVNVWNNSGTPNVQKADAATGKEAHGFVLAAVTSGDPATVYFEGSNTHLTGLTAGPVFLSTSTPGGTQSSAPTGSGQISQRLGTAFAATSLTFEPQPVIVVA
jgi:hypothetical protein